MQCCQCASKSFPIGFLLALVLGICITPPASTQDGVRGRMGGSRWGANYFPNVPLTTHEGKTIRFFDDLLKDKVVVINFIYTSCPDVCPLETARLSELQAILGDRVGEDVFLYSITIDPEVDTPQVLAEYAKAYGAQEGWIFLTGDEDDIILLRKKLSLYRPEIQSEDSNDHNLSLIIGNQRTGRWMKRSPMENPYFLANQVGGWLHNWKVPSPNQLSYANAPKLRNPTTGENLFRTRCSACHVIGNSDQVPPHMRGRLLGPDLFNVTQRRDRDWLARWLAEPDKMLAEKDPIAVELYAKHDKVAMPNFSLNEKDVTALIDFLESESQRVEKVQKFRASVAGSEAAVSEKFATRSASCCQKNKGPVLTVDGSANADGSEASSADSGSSGDSDGEVADREVSVASLILPALLGGIFLMLAFVRDKSGKPGAGRL